MEWVIAPQNLGYGYTLEHCFTYMIYVICKCSNELWDLDVFLPTRLCLSISLAAHKASLWCSGCFLSNQLSVKSNEIKLCLRHISMYPRKIHQNIHMLFRICKYVLPPSTFPTLSYNNTAAFTPLSRSLIWTECRNHALGFGTFLTSPWPCFVFKHVETEAVR